MSEFEFIYWSERSRCLGTEAAIQFQLDAVDDFEQDISRYVPDPEPQIRDVEERELRRRAFLAMEAIDGA